MPRFRRLTRLLAQLQSQAPTSSTNATATNKLEDTRKQYTVPDLQAGIVDFYNQPLLVWESRAGATATDMMLRRQDAERLAAATVPACMHFDSPPGSIPCLWSRSE